MASAPIPPVASTLVPNPTAPPMSEGARIANTFFAPSKTFTDLRRSASWWGPWLLLSIFSLAFIFTLSKQVGFEQASKNQVERSSRAEQFDKLTSEQQEKQLQLSAKIVGIFGYGTPAFILLYVLIGGVVLWATFKVGAAAETSFGQGYAIMMYGSLPGIVGAILGIVTLFAGVNPEGFDINNPIGTNLAYYLDPETTAKFVRAMASSIDLINIWTIVLIGIGYASTSKVKRSTAIAIVAGWYVIYKLLTSVLASLG
jgi:hypothetical protein